MRKAVWLGLVLVCPAAPAEESALERAGRKTGAFVERTADRVSPALERAGQSIERGARATGRAIDRAGNSVAKGAEKVHRQIDDKVRPKK